MNTQPDTQDTDLAGDLIAFIGIINSTLNAASIKHSWGLAYHEAIDIINAQAPKGMKFNAPKYKYKVKVTVNASISKSMTVEVEAGDEEEAQSKVQDMLYSDQIDESGDGYTVSMEEWLSDNLDLTYDLDNGVDADIDYVREIRP
jgi:hypothetical protein